MFSYLSPSLTIRFFSLLSLLIFSSGQAFAAAPMDSANPTPKPPAFIKTPQSEAAKVPANSEANPGGKPSGKDDFSEYGFSPRTPKSVNDTIPRKSGGSQSAATASSNTDSSGAEAEEEAPVARTSRSRRSARHKKKPRQPLPQQATSELMIRPEDRSPEIVDSAATVRSQVNEVKDPIRRPSFLLGVSVQQYQPAGRAQLQGADSVDLGDLESKPMIGVDFRWMPLTLESAPQFDLGVFASAAYVSHAIKLRAPTGVMIDRTNLQTFKLQAGASIDWHKESDSRLGVRSNLGLGQFNTSQSSVSSFASGAAAQIFGSAGLFVDYMVFDHVSVSAGYEHRVPLGAQTANLKIQPSNFLLGLSGGFQ